MNIDKTKYWQLLNDFEDKWDMELSSTFDQYQRDSTTAQMLKSKKLLDKAKTEEECIVVENRVRKLSDWLYHNRKIA